MRWLAGLAIPGAAHWLSGERGKAAVYAAMVLTFSQLGRLVERLEHIAECRGIGWS